MEVFQALSIKDLRDSVSIISAVENTMTLAGKRALVTGASRGIGAANISLAICVWEIQFENQLPAGHVTPAT